MPTGIEIPIGMPLDQLIKDEKAAVSSIKATETQLNNSLNKTGANLRKSSTDFQKWNRIIQDSPYGIQGVANNLQELIPNIGLLSIGLNLALTALTFVNVGTSNWTRGLQGNKKAVDDLSLSGAEYAATLDVVNKAQLTGTQDAQKELTTLNLLFATYKNGNASLETRKNAYQQLQTLYPDYFSNLKFENEATAKQEAAYKGLSTAILATARARAAADLITKNQTQKLENEQKIINLERERLKLEDSLRRQQFLDSTSGGSALGAGVGATDQRARNTVTTENAITDNKLKQRNLGLQIVRIDGENLQLLKSVNAEIAKGAQLTGSIGSADGKPKKVALQKPLPLELTKGVTLINPSTVATAVYDALPVIDLNAKVKGFDALKATTGLAEYLKIITQFKDQLKYVIDDGIGSALGGISEALGSALISGNNVAKSLGSTLLSTLGQVLGQLGQLAIATGVALLGIKTALQTLNPFAAIAAGVALLALSGVVKGAAGKIGGQIGGGGSFDAPSPSGGVTPSFAGGGNDFGGGRVVFEISGTNLVGVLNREGQTLRRIGP